MAIAISIEQFLSQQFTDYSLLSHPHTESSTASAQAAHVPPQQLAKAVVMKDSSGCHLMAVVPACNKLRVGLLSYMLDRDLQLVNEWELSQLFQDCEPGAVPALGQAYGMDVIWDEQLANCEDIYLEGGDHRQLIHINQLQFQDLMGHCMHDDISVSTTNQPDI